MQLFFVKYYLLLKKYKNEKISFINFVGFYFIYRIQP